MKKIIICMLDKTFPPEHSFVDGMLSSILPDSNNEVFLITSRGECSKNSKVYNKSIALPMLNERIGIKRFTNFIILLRLLKKLINENKNEDNSVVFFVRNEPVYLLAASFLRKKVHRLIFQQSFPHEKANVSFLKKIITTSIFKISRRSVDAILTVSPLAIKRLERFFGRGIKSAYIPLLNNSSDVISQMELINKQGERSKDPVKFVYTGTHDRSRELFKVVNAIQMTNLSSSQATFTFIGGKDLDIDFVRKNSNALELEKMGIIQFQKSIRREELIMSLRQYDVGLSLIPPIELFRESSPTKLVEYMGAGLAVIASKGIPLQDDFLNESNAGFLSEWNEIEMAQAILNMQSDENRLKQFQINAVKYSKETLIYENYLPILKDLIS